MKQGKIYWQQVQPLAAGATPEVGWEGLINPTCEVQLRVLPRKQFCRKPVRYNVLRSYWKCPTEQTKEMFFFCLKKNDVPPTPLSFEGYFFSKNKSGPPAGVTIVCNLGAQVHSKKTPDRCIYDLSSGETIQ